MEPKPALLSRIKAVAFDAYGTLFDVHSAVGRHAARIGPEAPRLSEIWRTKQLEYSWVLSLAERYEPFSLLTERALDFALARCPSVDRSLRNDLLVAYRTLDAFPEVPDLLERLNAHALRTVILSNGDPGMLLDAIASAQVADRIDLVLSVDSVRAYKTSPRAYELVTSALQVRPRDVVFVSSNRWDVAGAAAFGFRPVWVNRSGMPEEYPGLEPVATIPDLSTLGRSDA
jgi:2-haloacid dehalogenase